MTYLYLVGKLEKFDDKRQIYLHILCPKMEFSCILKHCVYIWEGGHYRVLVVICGGVGVQIVAHLCKHWC